MQFHHILQMDSPERYWVAFVNGTKVYALRISAKKAMEIITDSNLTPLHENNSEGRPDYFTTYWQAPTK